MSARSLFSELLRKVLISIAIIVAVLMAGAAFLAWKVYSNHRGLGAPEYDPVRQSLAGPVPAVLRGLANSIDQFSSLHEVADRAEQAGYHCAQSLQKFQNRSERDGQVRQDLECVKGSDEAGPGDTVLVVGIALPGQRAVSLELRRLPGKRWLFSGDSPGSVIARANGIEFASPARFVDLIIDAAFGGMQNCFSPANCSDRREYREKYGPPVWDGKPRNMGPREQIETHLHQLGLQCSPLQSPDGKALTGDETTLMERCATNSFSGQVQTVDLVLDPMTSAVTALDFGVANQTLRVPLSGGVPEQPPGGSLLLVSNQAGEVLRFPLAPNFFYHGSDQLKRIDTLNAASRNRVIDINLKQITSMLAQPDALPVPQLQKLDVASALLTRLGAPAFEQVRPMLIEAPVALASAMALADCALHEQAPDCLTAMVIARPDVSANLLAAYKEANDASQGLPDAHSAIRRLQVLALQIKLSQGNFAQRPNNRLPR